MKIMNVSLTIDVCNVKQVEALERLMRTLGELPMVETLKLEPATAMEKGPGPSATVPEKATRSRKFKNVAAEQPQQVEKEMGQAPDPASMQEEEAPEEEAPQQAKEKINLATLRALTAEKAIMNRAEIKEKLSQLGAANVTSIPEDKYNEYHDFIASL